MGDDLPVIEFGLGRRAVPAWMRGDSHVCALLEDGNMRCWGDNIAGQLGTPESTSNVSNAVSGSDRNSSNRGKHQGLYGGRFGADSVLLQQTTRFYWLGVMLTMEH